MGEEKQICLGIQEVLVLKEWFGFIVNYSEVEKRDSDLVEKLAAFEKEVAKGE